MRLSALALLVMVIGLTRAADPCCSPAPQTICVPAVETKTTTRPCYRVKTVQVCLPFKPSRCSACEGCGECGRPREVRLLIKRFVKVQKCEVICKPQQCTR
jgi:hypothetical protein